MSPSFSSARTRETLPVPPSSSTNLQFGEFVLDPSTSFCPSAEKSTIMFPPLTWPRNGACSKGSTNTSRRDAAAFSRKRTTVIEVIGKSGGSANDEVRVSCPTQHVPGIGSVEGSSAGFQIHQVHVENFSVATVDADEHLAGPNWRKKQLLRARAGKRSEVTNLLV